MNRSFEFLSKSSCESFTLRNYTREVLFFLVQSLFLPSKNYIHFETTLRVNIPRYYLNLNFSCRKEKLVYFLLFSSFLFFYFLYAHAHTHTHTHIIDTDASPGDGNRIRYDSRKHVGACLILDYNGTIDKGHNLFNRNTREPSKPWLRELLFRFSFPGFRGKIGRSEQCFPSFLRNCVRNRSTGSRRYAHLETTLRGVLDRIFNRGFYAIPTLSLSPDLPINRKWPFYDSLVCYWNAIPSSR